MKKWIVLLALCLGGCAQLSAVETGVALASTSIANPVTKTRLAEIELAGDIIIQGMLVYKHACVAKVVDVNCRINIAMVQVYTRQIPPLVKQLRGFVKNNDQMNAAVVFNELTQLYTNAKSAAANVGINLGGGL